MPKSSKSLVVKPVPVPKDGHPPPNHDTLMKHEYTMGLIAPKGAGKTTVICNWLKFNSGYFHTILIFSPTINSDDKWDWVKGQKLLSDNVKLKKWIRDQKARVKKDSVVIGPPLGQEMEGMVNKRDKFDGYIPEEHFFDDYDDDTFRSIMEEQKSLITLLKKHGESKYLANRILIIFDDLVGSALFAGSRGSYFKGRVFILYYIYLFNVFQRL